MYNMLLDIKTHAYHQDMILSAENATHLDLIEVDGMNMAHSEIPNNLRSYCPELFSVEVIIMTRIFF